ncbi:Putative syntaxin-2 [Caenorhabditis elegans]|uniref:Putative syntaxin-2 n=1 Tax=Caenorhabditis elegans TaxID=6239 RepID=STX2_CAEEL|nr:Putative syntaxin-2 [Caenorhabditis elegans]Q20574.4 RecName: Full=Putative syntaxin-2 [Caenorhabditis elegans]CAA93492.4 Putative syntaxin-2 [Caenorhabditis elegans]|eukprot:NP_510323.3 Putative syntaxin-2 [Caenorhabditis elegans]
MRDRLNEFQSRVTDRFDEVELSPARPPSAAEYVDRRFEEVRNAIASVRGEIEKLRRDQQHVLALTIADPRDKNILENQIGTIRRRTGDLRKLVRQAEDDFLEFTKQVQSVTEKRMRQNQLELLKDNLNKLINLFNETHQDYKSRVSVRVRRQLQTVGQDLTDEDINRIMENSGSEQLFFREVNPLSVSGQAAYEDVKKRHGEIKDLENNIAMLEEIFLDLQHLTEAQDEMVTNIDNNVENGLEQVKQGSANVKTAVEYKKSAMRKKICVAAILITILLILIIVAIILAVVLSRGNNNNK